MIFKLWPAGEDRELELNAAHELSGGTFGEAPFAVVALQGEAVPKDFSLAQNYPNPFWSEATSRYQNKIRRAESQSGEDHNL
jgi:hypothetical protein